MSIQDWIKNEVDTNDVVLFESDEFTLRDEFSIGYIGEYLGVALVLGWQ